MTSETSYVIAAEQKSCFRGANSWCREEELFINYVFFLSTITFVSGFYDSPAHPTNTQHEADTNTSKTSSPTLSSPG